MSTPDLQISTHLIHHPYQPPEGFVAPQPPVHKASTVIFENVAAMRRRQWLDKSSYTYGLHGTPTTFLLEERLSALEGGLQCLLVPSGLAAIATTSLALLRTGDEMLLPDNAYGPNKTLSEGELAHFGVRHQCYDAMAVFAGVEWLQVPACHAAAVQQAGKDMLPGICHCPQRSAP